MTDKLSKETARDLAVGRTLKCHVVPGLELRARASVKSWHVYYRSPVDGSQRRPKIGNFPALTIEAARDAAKELLRRIAKGEDISADRQEKRHAPTVKDLFDWYMTNHADPNKSVRSAEEDRRNGARHVLPALGAKKVADVTGADVRGALNGISERAGKVASNRVRSLLCTMFNFAEREALKWRPKRSNPIDADVPPFPEFARRRFLRPDEFVRVRAEFVTSAVLFPRETAAVLAILYCGSRVTELVTAKWTHVEGDRIVRADHKTQRTGEPRVIHFPRQVRQFVESLPKCPHGYLFGRGMTRHKAFDRWEEIRKAAGCGDVQLRDLRRSFASAARSRGVTLSAIGDSLGHADEKTTRRYAYLFDGVVAATVQDTADAIDAMMLSAPKTE